MPSSKIKSRKICRRAICENFNSQKFLAIRYTGHAGRTLSQFISPIPIINLIIGTNAHNIPAHVVQELGTYLVTEHRLEDQRSEVELPQRRVSVSRKRKRLTTRVYSNNLLYNFSVTIPLICHKYLLIPAQLEEFNQDEARRACFSLGTQLFLLS